MIADASRQPFNPRRAVLALIAAGLALRIAFAATTGLGIDETYMVALGRHWALGYFDHPPLAWWLSHAASLLLGEANWAVRAPFIALFAISTWLMWRLTSELFGETAGFIAAFALNFAPVLGVTTGTWVLPDGPLDAALLAGALCLTRVLLVKDAPGTLWLWAGVWAGLATLSKLHGVFLLAGAGLFLLSSPAHRRWLATPWPWLGAAIALAVVSPALLWNAQHDWASLSFQGGRAAARVFRPWMPLVALAGQAVFLAPWVWGPLMAATWRYGGARARDPASWLLICLAIGPVATFTLVPAWSDQKPYFHWAAPGYLMLFPLLGRYLAAPFEAGSKYVGWWLKGAAGFCVIAMAALSSLSMIPQIASAFAPPNRDPLAEIADWTTIAADLRARGALDNPRLFVVARRWYEAAKIDYALHGALDVACIGDDCRGYEFVAMGHSHAGDDALALLPDNAPPEALDAIARHFASLAPAPAIIVRRGPFEVARLKTLDAKSYRP